MKIFIDCGAYDGDSIRLFMKSDMYTPDTRIVGFEPNRHISKEKYPSGVELIKKAVWTNDEVLSFYVGEKNPTNEGGSLLVEKTSGDLDKKNPLNVEAIDFNKWLLENTKIEDEVILKMDIEGAEYKILPKLIESGVLARLSRLYLETHWQRIGMHKSEHDVLMQKIYAILGDRFFGEYSHIASTGSKIVVYGIPAGDMTGGSTRIRFYKVLNSLPNPYQWKPWSDKLRCNILFVQKLLSAIPQIKRAKANGVPVVYDCDDGDGTNRRKGDDREIFEMVDAITTDTEPRAEAFRKATKTPVYVVPDSLDYFKEKPKPIELRETIKRVCTFGTYRSVRSSVQFMKELSNIIRTAYICDRPIEGLEKSKLIYWGLKNFIEKLSKYDVCVLTHLDDEEKQWKSNHRILTPMALGIPTIVSDTPAYSETMEMLGLGYLVAKTPTDTVAIFNKIKSVDVRKDIQKKFTDYAWDNHHAEISGKILSGIFEKLIR